jgi:hypothetical protein
MPKTRQSTFPAGQTWKRAKGDFSLTKNENW